MTIEKKRPWFQFHLSTALVAMIVAGGLVGVVCWRIQNAGVTPELRRIEFADPVADANSALANKDFHFIGIRGIRVVVPGVQSDVTLLNRCGVRAVDGTSDYIESEEQWRLMGIACGYAKKYNCIILNAIAPEKK